MTVELDCCLTPLRWLLARSGSWTARLVRCASCEGHTLSTTPPEAWKPGWVSALADKVGYLKAEAVAFAYAEAGID